MTATPTPEHPCVAVVLLSGGLDSATTLALARAEGFRCCTMSFDYGQRHRAELAAAARVAEHLGSVDHRVIRIDLAGIGGSALTDDIDVPKHRTDAEMADGIPVTYVPARNMLFLSCAVGFAEVMGASDVFIGVNAVDYSGYPDCRPAFIDAFSRAAREGTRCGVEGSPISIRTPLISLTKADIIRHGINAGVDYAMTVTCYEPDESGAACGACDACALRRRGFEEAAIADPTRYVQGAV